MKLTTILISLFITLLAACSTSSPLGIYKDFESACDKGDIATAETLLTESGKISLMSSDYDVCITFMPDAFERFMVSMGGEASWKASDIDPEVEIAGNTAYLTWIEPDLSFTREWVVTLFKTDEGWRIEKTRMFEE